MKSVRMWTLEQLRERLDVSQTCINGRWVPLRPENFKKYMMTFWERLYHAWEVFQCRAEAFKWPEGQ